MSERPREVASTNRPRDERADTSTASTASRAVRARAPVARRARRVRCTIMRFVFFWGQEPGAGEGKVVSGIKISRMMLSGSLLGGDGER